jgi:hypothetical protein
MDPRRQPRYLNQEMRPEVLRPRFAASLLSNRATGSAALHVVQRCTWLVDSPAVGVDSLVLSSYRRDILSSSDERRAIRP